MIPSADDASHFAPGLFGFPLRRLAVFLSQRPEMDSIYNDLRFAFRSLHRTPGFTAAAVLTLALGIGANTAIFSIVDHVILRPLAYEDPDNLYAVHEVIPRVSHMTPAVPVSANHFVEWKRAATSFESMALIGDVSLNLTGSGEPEELLGARASVELFPMLGVRPQLGRVFLPEEDQVGRDRVVLLNDELWRRRLGADPHIVGRKITLNGEPYEVVGILPPDFRFPKIADLFQMTIYEGRPQIWKPLALTKGEATNSEDFNFSCIVRLKDSATRSQALDELNRAQAVIAKDFPDLNLHAMMISLDEQITGRSKSGLQMLLGAVGVVLLIGCVNITNLLLARATNRRKEMAVRSAIGASAARLLRQALAETAVLAAIGTLLGIAVAHAVLQGVLVYAPVDLPRMDEVRLDGRVLMFTLVLAVLTSFACGLLPAWYFSKAEPQEAMKAVSRTTTPGRMTGRLRTALIGAEVALSVICLVAGGLLLHSFVQLLRVDPGFRSERVVTTDLGLPASRYPNGAKRAEFYRAVQTSVEALPGVSSVGITNGLPVTGQGGNSAILVEGVTGQLFEQPLADVRGVNPDFFRTMSIPLRAGSIFAERDRGGPIAVVSAALAARAWPNQNPLGKRIRIGSNEAPLLEVVGVVGEVRGMTLEGRFQLPTVYVPYWQRAFSQFSIAVKTAGVPEAVYATVRQAIRSLDPELPIPAMRTMNDVVMASVAPRQFQMRLVLLFGVVALLLASLGIFGVVSYTVAQRTSEMGLRMALGATPQNIGQSVLGRAMLPVAIGLAVGLATAVGAGRLLRAMLFGVTPTDPVTLSTVTVVLLVVAFVACCLPARRAMRVNPMVALRTE